MNAQLWELVVCRCIEMEADVRQRYCISALFESRVSKTCILFDEGGFLRFQCSYLRSDGMPELSISKSQASRDKSWLCSSLETSMKSYVLSPKVIRRLVSVVHCQCCAFLVSTRRKRPGQGDVLSGKFPFIIFRNVYFDFRHPGRVVKVKLLP